MALKYHGIRYDNGGDSGWFHFGMLRLLHWLEGYFIVPRFTGDEKRPEWPHQWFDRRFSQAVTKFQYTFWMFDRAAGHFSLCVDLVKCYHNAELVEEYTRHLDAIGDIPLYLDSMLSYLRIQADCLTTVIPTFYGQRGKKADLPRYSFRDHLNWFAKQPAFDQPYAAILNSHRGWFDTLAGKKRGEGIRDVVMHYLGMYQLGWTVPDQENKFAFRASLVNDSGFVRDDLVPTMKSVLADYFTYLDKTFIHFAERIRAEIGEEFIPTDDKATQYYRFDNGALPSFWVYPLITP